MENYGFLESGILIQVGTVLKVDGEFRQVITFRGRAPQKSYGRDVYYFTIVAQTYDGFGVEYDKQDLEEMVAKGELKIYNQS